jgi:dienelactone hydrolase
MSRVAACGVIGGLVVVAFVGCVRVEGASEPDAEAPPDAGEPDDAGPEAGADADLTVEAGADGAVDSGGVPDADGASDAEVAPQPEPGAPLYEASRVYETTIAASGDLADVYYPTPPDLAPGAYAFPVAVLLQGARVDKQYYAGFAATVARYGFIVVVPNHVSTTLLGSGFYAEQSEPADVLAQLRAEHDDPASPVRGIVDATTLVLLGHSYGGVAGLNVIRDVCMPPSCSGGFERPVEVAGGAFYGTNMATPIIGTVPDIANDGLPVALIQGTLDTKAWPGQAQATYEHIQDLPKALISVTGANHYGLCDTNNPPGAGADGSAPTLDQAVSVETTARWAAIFLRARVLGDATATAYLETLGDAADPNVEVTQAW